jgi:CRISPR-associated protein Csd1
LSWLQRLNETYEACRRSDVPDLDLLAPSGSMLQRTQLEITLHEDGSFVAGSLQDHDTIMFTTEDSASRSGKMPAANPLTEQLEYCAKGIEKFGGDPGKFIRYTNLLSEWNASGLADYKTAAVLKYVESGTLLEDLLREKVLIANGDELEKIRVSKSTKLDPAKIWVRWRVYGKDLDSATWSDERLQEGWHRFETSRHTLRQLCMLSGEQIRTTQKHPKNIRKGGDNAKLISANDSDGYTFRGRFASSEQAATLGYEKSQKAHNTLRWLIHRQGECIDTLTIVAWAVRGQETPKITDNTLSFLGGDEEHDALPAETSQDGPSKAQRYQGDVGQAEARRLNKRLQGYRARLSDRDDIVVMALDSATPGRMAILYYRELRGSEFLDRIERWHSALAWPQFYGKELRFVGAPAPRDIAEAAYGRREGNRLHVDEKLSKATVERLLPSILDGRRFPRDLQQAVFRRAVNRAGMQWWEFERVLGIACSLARAIHPERNYSMSLEENRRTRDYLYGRLLAIADSIEEIALSVAGEGRETNAARLMQRFADHPVTTWRTLELQLRPYISRLRGSRYAGALIIRQRLLDQIISSFPQAEDGNSAFLDNRRLTGEFLLGFHSQREELRRNKSSETSTNSEGEEN